MRYFIYSALALIAAAGPALARPLDPAGCDSAKQEQAALTDVPHVMERGPEWARANASPETLQRIARWIELTEILSFRCGRVVLTAEAQRAAAAADLIENPPPEPAAPTAAKLNSLPTTGGESPVVASPAQPAAAAVPAEAPVVKKAKTKAKSKPKPQADTAAVETAPVNGQSTATDDKPPPHKRHTKPATTAAQAPAAPPSAAPAAQ